MRAVLDDNGNLKLAADSPRSALDGPPKWEHDGDISPDGYVVNTVQPPYQPSGIPPAKGGDPKLADPAQNPLPPQTLPTLGDRLSDKGIDWAWYAHGWDVALAYRGAISCTRMSARRALGRWQSARRRTFPTVTPTEPLRQTGYA